MVTYIQSVTPSILKDERKTSCTIGTKVVENHLKFKCNYKRNSLSCM